MLCLCASSPLPTVQRHRQRNSIPVKKRSTSNQTSQVYFYFRAGTQPTAAAPSIQSINHEQPRGGKTGGEKKWILQTAHFLSGRTGTRPLVKMDVLEPGSAPTGISGQQTAPPRVITRRGLQQVSPKAERNLHKSACVRLQPPALWRNRVETRRTICSSFKIAQWKIPQWTLDVQINLLALCYYIVITVKTNKDSKILSVSFSSAVFHSGVLSIRIHGLFFFIYCNHGVCVYEPFCLFSCWDAAFEAALWTFKTLETTEIRKKRKRNPNAIIDSAVIYFKKRHNTQAASSH